MSAKTEGERLARLEEAIKNIEARLDIGTQDRKEMQAEMKDILFGFGEALKSHETRDQERFEKILTHLEEKYVRKNEFTPIKNLVFAFVGVSLSAIVGSIYKLIFI